MEKFDTDSSLLHPILTECRVIKSELELALIQYANDVSSEAHIEVQNVLLSIGSHDNHLFLSSLVFRLLHI
jgi:Xaa-Pro aminopeptidase